MLHLVDKEGVPFSGTQDYLRACLVNGHPIETEYATAADAQATIKWLTEEMCMYVELAEGQDMYVYWMNTPEHTNPLEH